MRKLMDILEAISPHLYCQELVEAEVRDARLASTLDIEDLDAVAWRITWSLHERLTAETRARVSALTFKTIAMDVLFPIASDLEEARLEAEEEEDDLEDAKSDARNAIEAFIETEGEHPDETDVLARARELLASAGLRIHSIKGGKAEVRRGRKRTKITRRPVDALKRLRGGGELASLADAIDAARHVGWLPPEATGPAPGIAAYWANSFDGLAVTAAKIDDSDLEDDFDDQLDDDADDFLLDMGYSRHYVASGMDAIIASQVRSSASCRRYVEWQARKNAKHPRDSRARA